MIEKEKPKNTISFCVEGPRALFSEPVTRTGGEKSTYAIPTYEALKGITESIYWKPTIKWYIDRVRVMNKICTSSVNVKTRKWEKNEADLSIYTYLTNVRYQVVAHFEWNTFNMNKYKEDLNEQKHFEIAMRSIEKGGRRDIFLGTRECQGYVYPVDFGDGVGDYDKSGSLNMGLMWHGFTYPNENPVNTNGNLKDSFLYGRYATIKMTDGVIEFENPDSFIESNNTKDKSIYKIRKCSVK